MDPLHVSMPARSGFVDLPGNDRLQLYYELRGTENEEKILLVMGAFATLKSFDELAVSTYMQHSLAFLERRMLGFDPYSDSPRQAE